MKILITTPIFPPEIGGPATYVKEFAQRAKKKDNDVEIITLTDVENDNLDDIDITSVKRTRNKLARHSSLFSKILKKAKKHDLIYAQNPGAVGLPSVLAGSILRKPVVVKYVGDTAWEKAFREGKTKKLLEDFLKNPDVNKNIIKIERFVFKRATKIITPSEFLAFILETYHKVPREKIVVIPNAVDISDLKGKVMKKNAVITVARLVPWKAVDDIINAMAGIQKRRGSELWVVGEGPEQNALEKLAKRKKIKVTFFGNISHKEVLKKIASAKLFVLNSLYEGLPHVLIESMAVGTPIVATDICGNPELIENGKNGLLVKPKNVKALEAAMDLILTDKQKAASYTTKSKLKSKEYSWELLMKRTLKELTL